MHNHTHKACIHVYWAHEYAQNKYIQTHTTAPWPKWGGINAACSQCVSIPPSLCGADTDIDCWITNPSPESIKSLCRIDLAGEENGSGGRGRGGWGEQQDSEIHRWIFDFPWLSVILYCVLRNRREKLTRQETQQTALSIADWLLRDIWLFCIRNIEAEEETLQTFKDFPLSDINRETCSCFMLLVKLTSPTFVLTECHTFLEFKWNLTLSASSLRAVHWPQEEWRVKGTRQGKVSPQTTSSALIRGSDRFYSTVNILVLYLWGELNSGLHQKPKLT